MATHAGVALELGIHRPAAGGKASKVIYDDGGGGDGDGGLGSDK